MEPGATGCGPRHRTDAVAAHYPRQRGRCRLPYFGGNENPHFRSVKQDPVLTRRVPSKTLTLADGSEKRVVSVYDLVLANYGLDRGLEDSNAAESYGGQSLYPAWGEQITGVPARLIEKSPASLPTRRTKPTAGR